MTDSAAPHRPFQLGPGLRRGGFGTRRPGTELRALTGVRGIAAWLVVLYHIRLSIAGLPAPALALFAHGYLAVDFFFLLSGFVIWLTWHDRLREEGVARFLQKRLARIWPLHLFMLGCALALALLLAATGRADPDFPFAELPLHVVLLQNWGFTRALAWNDPAWSISAEWGAYLLFPLLLTIDLRRVPTLGLITIAASLLGGLHVAMGDQPSFRLEIPRFGLIRCLAEFATGTIVSALWLRSRESRWALSLAMIAAAGFLLVWAAGIPETLVAPAAFAAILLLLALTAGSRGNPLETRAIHYLGEISYATYLGHFILWKAFKLAFVSDAHAVGPASIAFYLLVVLAASVALYHLVERPAQRRVNGWRLSKITLRHPERVSGSRRVR